MNFHILYKQQDILDSGNQKYDISEMYTILKLYPICLNYTKVCQLAETIDNVIER